MRAAGLMCGALLVAASATPALAWRDGMGDGPEAPMSYRMAGPMRDGPFYGRAHDPGYWRGRADIDHRYHGGFGFGHPYEGGPGYGVGFMPAYGGYWGGYAAPMLYAGPMPAAEYVPPPPPPVHTDTIVERDVPVVEKVVVVREVPVPVPVYQAHRPYRHHVTYRKPAAAPCTCR